MAVKGLAMTDSNLFSDDVPLTRTAAIRDIFATNLKLQLDRTGMSQSKLARLIGCNKYEISRYTRAEQTPKPAKVREIADALSCQPDDLVPGYVQEDQRGKGASLTMRQLANGNVWMEFVGAFKPPTASEMFRLIAERTDDLASD